MAAKLVHFEMPAQDTKRALKFYSTVFGWTFRDTSMPGIEYHMTEQRDGPVGAVYPAQGGEKGPVIYFGVDDIDAALRTIRSSGGTVGGKGAVEGQGWFAACSDTEGNKFSVWQDDKAAPMLAPEESKEAARSVSS
jgi:predicted enzyme related to lactoylglutathione lyase